MGKHNKPNPNEVPQTISADRWDRLCDGVADAMSKRTDDERIQYGGVCNAVADNAKWN